MAWIIPFKSINGHDCEIVIGTTGSSDVTLTAGPDPFVIQGDSDPDFFSPIRTQTGTIKVVGVSTDFDDLMNATTPLDRPVYFYVDDVLQWVGFMECESFAQEWSSVQHEVSISVKSPLETLKGIYPNTSTHGYATIGVLLYEMVMSLGGTTFVADMYFTSRTPAATALARIINRDNWIELLDEQDVDSSWFSAASYYDILEDLCKAHGWQLQECGTRWIFSSHDYDHVYYQVTTSNLISSSITATLVDASQLAFSDFTWYGTENTVSILQGKRSVTVTGNTNEAEENVWSLEFEKLNVGTYSYNTYRDSSGTYYLYHVPYTAGDDIEISVRNTQSLKYSFINAAAVEGSSFERADILQRSSDSGWPSLTDYVSLCPASISSSEEAITITPRAVITTPCDNRYLMLKTKASKWAAYADGIASIESSDSFAVNISIKFGSQYWQSDGTWAATEELLSCTIEEGGVTWIPPSRTNFRWPSYPRTSLADGSFISLPEGTSGTVEIKIYQPDTTMDGWADVYAILFSSIDIELIDVVLEGEAETDSGQNTERAYIGNGFSEDYSIEANLTCGSGAQYGSGVILEDSDGYTRATTLDVTGNTPELSLCNRLQAYYSSNSIMHNAVVHATSLISPHQYLTGGADDIEECIISQEINWADETATITTLSV